MMDELIALVRSEPSLYDTHHPKYPKKPIKDFLWAKIARKAGYKDGPAAKDAWLKLRNCHRDAIRRRNKMIKSAPEPASVKHWRYEKDMEFLVPYMTSRSTTNDTIDNLDQEVEVNTEESVIDYPQVEFVSSPQRNDTIRLEEYAFTLPNSTSNTSPDSKEAVMHKIDLSSLITRSLNNYKKVAKEKAEKRPLTRDNEDDLQQFFNTMYTITKKMPSLSQLRLRREIFNLVSDEEERLLNLQQTQANDESV